MGGKKGGLGATIGGIAGGIVGGPAGAALGSSILGGLGGSLDASDAAVDAARNNARLAGLQANEVLKRSEINISTLRKEAIQFGGEQVSAFAKSGIDVGGASPIMVREETISSFNREIFNTRREARFRATSIRAGAAANIAAAKAGARASTIGAVTGAVLGIAGGFNKGLFKLPNFSTSGSGGGSGGGGAGTGSLGRLTGTLLTR